MACFRVGPASASAVASAAFLGSESMEEDDGGVLPCTMEVSASIKETRRFSIFFFFSKFFFFFFFESFLLARRCASRRQ